MEEPLGLMFCLDCMYKHSRDLEHHLEDAVRAVKDREKRLMYEDMIDRVREIRSQVLAEMKNPIQSHSEKKPCLICGSSPTYSNPDHSSNPRKYLPHGLTSYEKRCKNYQHRLTSCIKQVEEKENSVISPVAVCRASVHLKPC